MALIPITNNIEFETVDTDHPDVVVVYARWEKKSPTEDLHWMSVRHRDEIDDLMKNMTSPDEIEKNLSMVAVPKILRSSIQSNCLGKLGTTLRKFERASLCELEWKAPLPRSFQIMEVCRAEGTLRYLDGSLAVTNFKFDAPLDEEIRQRFPSDAPEAEVFHTEPATYSQVRVYLEQEDAEDWIARGLQLPGKDVERLSFIGIDAELCVDTGMLKLAEPAPQPAM